MSHLRKITRNLVLACLWACAAFSAQDSVPPLVGIPRFLEVVQGFYRGGQPTSEGFEFLKKKGVKTIINLREENEEKSLVEKLGMDYVHIPIRARDGVADDAIRTFFRVINDPASRPVFVHCQRGADRTGAMVGFYRIAFQDWDGKKAYEEAQALGMRWWYQNLKAQLYRFAESRAAAKDPTTQHKEADLSQRTVAQPSK